MHMHVDSHLGHRCWILLELELRIVTSQLAWMLGPNFSPLQDLYVLFNSWTISPTHAFAWFFFSLTGPQTWADPAHISSVWISSRPSQLGHQSQAAVQACPGCSSVASACTWLPPASLAAVFLLMLGPAPGGHQLFRDPHFHKAVSYLTWHMKRIPAPLSCLVIRS